MKSNHFRGASAALNAFNKQFVPEITTLVIREHGKSYANDHDNTWRQEMDWSEQVADFLILKSRTFIRSQKIMNLSFIESLSKLMADYLSKYFVKSPQFKSRAQARRALELKLYNEFSYVQRLQDIQTQKVASNPIPHPNQRSGR